MTMTMTMNLFANHHTYIQYTGIHIHIYSDDLRDQYNKEDYCLTTGPWDENNGGIGCLLHGTDQTADSRL